MSKHYNHFKAKYPPILIFVEKFLHEQKNFLEKEFGWTIPLPQAKAHTAIFEFICPRAVLQSNFNTYSRDDADLFLFDGELSIYGVLRTQKLWQNDILPSLETAQSYHKNHGLDYSFTQLVFAHSIVPIDFDMEHSISSMLSMPDLDPLSWASNSMEITRFTIMPYTSNLEIAREDTDRSISIMFMGELNTRFSSDRTGASVRHRIAQELPTIPNAYFYTQGRYAKKEEFKLNLAVEAGKKMLKSDFCVVPQGDSPSSKRLFDAFATQCVPIVLADTIRYPFEEFVDYQHIVVQQPQFTKLLPTMMQINNKTRQIMRSRMRDAGLIWRLNTSFQIEAGDQMWAWLWSQLIRTSHSISLRRRDLLDSKFPCRM